MAHFYGSIRGKAKTQGTRCGTKNGGMSAHIRGWRIGARVELRHVDGKDVVQVFATNGSASTGDDELLATLVEKEAK
jgi:hypothetical protein